MDYGYLYPTHYGYNELVMVHFITKPVKNTHVIVVITIVFKGFKTRGIETIPGFPMFSYGFPMVFPMV